MTTQDKPYYKEFLQLLGEVRSQISTLQTDNQRYREENRLADIKINQLQQQLADAAGQIDSLKIQLSEVSSKTGAADQEGFSNNRNTMKSPVPYAPSLFDTLDDNDRMILRQQITELINRIDKHTNRSG